MAEQDQNNQQVQGQGKSNIKYYRTNIAGLSVIVGKPTEGEVAPQTVRFTPILQRWEGEMQKFGYLKTDNKLAQKKLAADFNVVEIDQDEYDKIMERAEDAAEPNVRRVA